MNKGFKILWTIWLLPLYFVLNGLNQNFGLVPYQVALSLLGKYSLITAAVVFCCWLLFRRPDKTFLASVSLMALYFFFGALRDSLLGSPSLKGLASYKILGIALGILVIAFFVYLWRTKQAYLRLADYLRYCMVILAFVSLGIFMYQSLRADISTLDFGDSNNEITRKITYTKPDSADPNVYWVVFDMYPSSATLRERWGFENPVDSILIGKGFYVAPLATSNYNFTHYSFTSTLDMCYLPQFSQNSIVTARDQVRGDFSLKTNNVLRVFESRGYDVMNCSIFDFAAHPSRSFRIFSHLPRNLIDFQTLYSRVKSDLGWLWYPGRDSARIAYYNRTITEMEDSLHRQNIDTCISAIAASGRSVKPVFSVIHVLLPHEPFIYKADGSLVYLGFNSKKEYFIPQLQYTNQLLLKIVDTILAVNANKNVQIILQGDHGYRYQDNDPEYKTESNKIFYAVFNNRHDYTGWYDDISSVNGFRMLFNQAFRTSYPRLKDSSFLLYYRQEK